MVRSRMLSGFVLGLFSLIAVVGCKSDGTSNSANTASAYPEKAVVISGGNSGGTRIYFPSQDGSVMSMSTSGAPDCAQCKADAEAYFKTGVLTPKCAMCGATHTAVENYTLKTMGHN